MSKLELNTGFNSRIDLGETPHIRIGLDTAHYSESGGETTQKNVFRYLYWGGDTAHNTTYYSNLGEDTAQENVFRCSHGVGTPHKNQSRFLAGWLALKRSLK